jgi:hypothetical protein
MIAQLTATAKTTVAAPVLKTHKVHQEKKEHAHHTHIHLHAAKPVVAAKPAVAVKPKLSF